MVIENSSVNLIHSGIDLNRIASSSVRGFNGDKTDNIKTQVSRERPNVEIKNKIMADGKIYNPDAPRGTYLDIKV